MKILLPSNQYSIEKDPFTETDLLQAENDSGLFKGMQVGPARLNLLDRHAESKSDTVPKSISSFISVAKADYLSIVVKLNNQKNLIVNEIYELEVHLFNKYNILYW